MTITLHDLYLIREALYAANSTDQHDIAITLDEVFFLAGDERPTTITIVEGDK